MLQVNGMRQLGGNLYHYFQSKYADFNLNMQISIDKDRNIIIIDY